MSSSSVSRPLRVTLLSILLTFAAAGTPSAQQHFEDLLQGLTATFHLTGERGPQNVIWIENGERYSYYRLNPFTGRRQIHVMSPETLEDDLLFDPEDHVFPDTDEPFHFESFEWSSDYRHLLFRTNVVPVWRYSGLADYYLYSLADGSLRPVAESAFTAQLSPRGDMAGIGRDGELFVVDLETGREKQLTFDSEEHLYNGRFGWVYEEEFGKVRAWEWSPDGRQIAFWQSDERHVKRFISTDFEGQYPEYTEIPYPKAGSENPEVRIGVIDLESGDRRWLDFDPGDGYIPRIYWTARERTLAAVHLNRLQNRIALYLFDTDNGIGERIFEEKAEQGWIDVFDFFSGRQDNFYFLMDREEFFWLSDRDGWRHLYRYDYRGKLLNRVTGGEWEISDVHRVDTESERIWYESTEASPLERHLYSIGFDGEGKIRHSGESGRHSFDVSPDGRWYIDRFSNTGQPLQVELRTSRNGGELVKLLEENRQVDRYTERYAYSPARLFSFTASDGTEIDGMMILPTEFDPEERYPLVLDIYGGPGAQGVFNEFETDGWRQYLAQKGYVIVNINNRGSGGYGREFEKSVYGRLGLLESSDYADLVRWLESEKPWVDGSRVAIRGHSYGGYLAALAPLLYPDLFRVSIVAAPVTDWRLYDTIYTERYMGLPDDNREGYEQSAVMTHASRLRADMLVVHASMDENVHVQNTMQMVRAFIDEGIDVDLRIYPPGTHGVAWNRESYLLLYRTYTIYLDRHLAPGR